jgi:bifunctional ADP-heptose synthase (sugar kinase/adenylyltransferase)
VHHVIRVRAQAGGAGTVVNNLSALGLGEIHALGFCGEDGEGYELRRALQATRGVQLGGFHASPDVRTFTYCKPILVRPGEPPEELNRLDSRNWDCTPGPVERALMESVMRIVPEMDAVVVMEQVDRAHTGAVTDFVRERVRDVAGRRPEVPVIADSRRGLRDYCHFTFKMNLAELGSLLGDRSLSGNDAGPAALRIAREQGKPVFVTMADQGIIGATATGAIETVPSHPLRGPIDVVGAGDSVTANLGAALAAGATMREAMELAMAAASIVVHQLGTTGSARVEEMRELALG